MSVWSGRRPGAPAACLSCGGLATLRKKSLRPTADRAEQSEGKPHAKAAKAAKERNARAGRA